MKASTGPRHFVVSPDNKFVYVLSELLGTVTTFALDGQTGKLSYIGSTPTEKQPRGFAIDAKGKFLVASGEKSDTISTYAIDPSTGALRFVQKSPVGKGANWVEIVSFD